LQFIIVTKILDKVILNIAALDGKALKNNKTPLANNKKKKIAIHLFSSIGHELSVVYCSNF
jgi:hypothetical protein